MPPLKPFFALLFLSISSVSTGQSQNCVKNVRVQCSVQIRFSKSRNRRILWSPPTCWTSKNLLQTNEKEQDDLLHIHKDKVQNLPDEEKLTKLSAVAVFAKTVGFGQFFMTKDTGDFFLYDGYAGLSGVRTSSKWWIIRAERLDSWRHENWSCIGSYDQLPSWKAAYWGPN